MDAIWRDVRFAARTLLRSPGFSAIAVLVLAIGIGANTAIFSVVNGLLFEGLPFDDSDRLVVFWDENAREGRLYNEVAPAHVAALEAARSFDGIAAYDYAGYTLTGAGQAERLHGFSIAHDFLPLLGVEPALGRNFRMDEDRAGAPAVALLGHTYWQQRFGGDPAVLGRPLTLNGTPTTVVGVLPAGFHWEREGQVYTPLAMPEAQWGDRGAHFLRVAGRLRPGTSFGEARAELATLSAVLERDHPGTGEGWQISVFPAVEGLFQGPIKPMLFALLGAVALVLLIACADLANLLLARATGRRREVAVRAALGARRSQMIRQLMTESVLLALVGGAAGLLLAVWIIDAITSRVPAALLEFMPRMQTIGLDGGVLVYTALISVATGLVFGLVPALRASRIDLSSELREGTRVAGGRHRLRGVLITAEVALALVLVTGAGLMIRSFDRQQRANPGFETDRVLTFWLSLPDHRYASGREIAAFQSRLLEQLGGLPGVEAASAANTIPMSSEGSSRRFLVEGRGGGAEADLAFANLRMVSDEYFQTLGVPLIRGRVFGQEDGPDAVRVAVVSRTLAESYFPGEDAIGKRVVLEGDTLPRTIVGVVGDLQDWRTGNRSSAYLFLPFQQLRSSRMGVMVRTATPPASLADAVRRSVFELDPELPVFELQTMTELKNFSLYGQRMSAGLMGGLAFVALLLAAFGIFGVVSYAVGQRTRELGIRMALGAARTDLLRGVVVESMRPVIAGMVLGLAGALLFGRALERVLFEISPVDPATFAGVALVLAATALLATWIPARRAVGVDPVAALNSE